LHPVCDGHGRPLVMLLSEPPIGMMHKLAAAEGLALVKGLF
jgi:hypothetical protein